MADQSFPPQHRLLNSHEFDAVFKGSQYRSACSEFLVLAIKNKAQQSRIGMVIGKKTTPLSVSRNRIKRVIRESFRLEFDKALGLDLVVVCRPAVNRSSVRELSGTLALLWRKLSQKVLDDTGND